MQQKFLEGNKTDPDLVAWRQQTWESIQNTADADRAEKIWVYWKLPGKGDSDNTKVNKSCSCLETANKSTMENSVVARIFYVLFLYTYIHTYAHIHYIWKRSLMK